MKIRAAKKQPEDKRLPFEFEFKDKKIGTFRFHCLYDRADGLYFKRGNTFKLRLIVGLGDENKLLNDYKTANEIKKEYLSECNNKLKKTLEAQKVVASRMKKAVKEASGFTGHTVKPKKETCENSSIKEFIKNPDKWGSRYG